MSDLIECKLEDVIAFGNGKVRPQTEGQTPVYGGNGILGYCDKWNYEGETIVIGRVGAYCGSVYYDKRPIWVSDNALAAKPKGKHSAVFLFYFLKNLNLNQLAEGSSHPLVTQTLLNAIDIVIPASEIEERAIADLLFSLDDKIDLLHRQNKTLEAMAETLFRQWFIEEAEDVRKDGCLGDVIDLIYGKALKEELRTGFGFPVVGSSGIVGYHSEYLVEGPGIVIGRKGTLGKVIYIDENFSPIDTTYYVQPKLDSDELFYEYFLLKTLNLGDLNSDSAVPGLNRNIALSSEIKIAPQEKIQSFNSQCAAYFNKLKMNNKQIVTLEKSRDLLLPKIMSGEIRVGDGFS